MLGKHHSIAFVLALAINSSVWADSWTIPTAGNAFATNPAHSRGVGRGGITLSGADESYSVYFHVDRPASIDLSLGVDARQETTIEVRHGERVFEATASPTEKESHVGTLKIAEAGYVRVDFRCLSPKHDSGRVASIDELKLASADEDLKVDFVRSNDGNMFYWGRRGPSVHLRYTVPRQPLRYAYSEITVPQGQDPIGTFYMANGFGEGYFGFQVNSPSERRVLFSVWSPFKTDNPNDIPKDQRISMLARGNGVHVGKFGNEGSGGQSYLIYPWKAGSTYRFLTKVEPDGNGNTVYTSWFGDKAKDEWRLIASFRRPRTDTNLRGFHSFLESFSPAYGHIGRKAHYGNVWVYTVDGSWHECNESRFSVDGTGNGRHRLDFDGGSVGGHFFLRNCGFVAGEQKPGATFTRESTAPEQPQINFAKLPMQ